MPIRYLLDEHIAHAYRSQLLRRAPDLVVWSIGDAGAPGRGTPDPAVLEWCERAGFVLITNNRRSMPGHLADHIASGRHVPGILVLGTDLGIGEAVDELLLIAAVSDEGEYRDLIVYLPVT